MVFDFIGVFSNASSSQESMWLFKKLGAAFSGKIGMISNPNAKLLKARLRTFAI
jgi:hypothetical protein